MPYWNSPKNSVVNIDSNTLLTNTSQKKVEFYEFEPGLVLDVILDKDHKYFNHLPQHTLNPTQWQTNVDGKPAKSTDPDYTWVGKALIRLYYSHQQVEKEDLIWAYPLDSNISEYPLINEVVSVVNYLGKYFYTRKINMFNLPNTNADFAIEPSIGGFVKDSDTPIIGNRELKLDNDANTNKYQEFQGPISKMSPNGGSGYQGVLGRYFWINKNIRSLKRREGDLIIESRFGQSIRFGSYDDDRNLDKAFKEKPNDIYKDYSGDGSNYTIDGKSYKLGGGNPMILIRNRQRDIKSTNNDEKNVGGYIVEDINKDGSSIQMTSGLTPTDFKTKCLKKMFGQGEEQSAFEPDGSTTFKYPSPATGDQIVSNSDRIIISARKNEMFQFSKQRMAFVTDSEYTVDAHDQIIFTTNNKTVLNSPAIYLGEYNDTNEPVLLGQTTINWLYDLCEWLLNHTHWYIHKHPDAGQAEPNKTQLPVQTEKLKQLRDTLHTLASRRVFTTGGGFASGHNGGKIQDGEDPVIINVVKGDGIPGGWKVQNRRS